MSMTKRAMEAERGAELAKEKQNCGCVFNWDDKFWEYCPEHQAEADEQAAAEYRELFG